MYRGNGWRERTPRHAFSWAGGLPSLCVSHNATMLPCNRTLNYRKLSIIQYLSYQSVMGYQYLNQTFLLIAHFFSICIATLPNIIYVAGQIQQPNKYLVGPVVWFDPGRACGRVAEWDRTTLSLSPIRCVQLRPDALTYLARVYRSVPSQVKT